MKRKWVLIACLGGAISILPLLAQPRAPKPGGQSQGLSNRRPSRAYSSDGERVFAQNCSRCHDAPQSFSPRISGAIVRHMRVRASLSEQDEKQILNS